MIELQVRVTAADLPVLRKHLTGALGDRLGMFRLSLDDGGTVSVESQHGEEYPEALAAEAIAACRGWTPPPPPYDRARRTAYLNEGCTIQALAVALWERDVEGRPEAAEEIQKKRLEVKRRFPKPPE